jgi:hypothetical protein
MYDERLEAALADLGTALVFPGTPPLAGGIASLLEPHPASRWPRPRSWSRAALLAATAVLVLAGVAGAIGLGTGAIHLRFADGSPLPTPVSSLPNHGFGHPTTLDDATAAVPWKLIAPTLPDLGEPDGIYLSNIPTGGTVTMAWGDRAGYPADDEGIGLVLTQFQADIGPETFEKMILEGTDVVALPVNGHPGWWIDGGTHAFFYRDATGAMVDTTLRLVGSTLIWEQDGLALRVEGAPNLAAALRVARSLE